MKSFERLALAYMIIVFLLSVAFAVYVLWVADLPEPVELVPFPGYDALCPSALEQPLLTPGEASYYYSTGQLNLSSHPQFFSCCQSLMTFEVLCT